MKPIYCIVCKEQLKDEEQEDYDDVKIKCDYCWRNLREEKKQWD